MRVEGYDLHCYCDAESEEHGHNEFPHTFAGDSKTHAHAAARRAGWSLGKTDLCPKCSGKPDRSPRAKTISVMDLIQQHREA